MTFEDAAMLAISTIQNSNEEHDNASNIKMSQIKLDTKEFEFIENSKIEELSKQAKTKYPSQQK